MSSQHGYCRDLLVRDSTRVCSFLRSKAGLWLKPAFPDRNSPAHESCVRSLKVYTTHLHLNWPRKPSSQGITQSIGQTSAAPFSYTCWSIVSPMELWFYRSRISMTQ